MERLYREPSEATKQGFKYLKNKYVNPCLCLNLKGAFDYVDFQFKL
jgi:hypothetical protein